MDTEMTTAATDGALALLSLVLLLRLRSVSGGSVWKKAVWGWVFRLMALASALGAVVHGVVLPEAGRVLLWAVLYLSSSLAVGLFLVGAVADWRGAASARAALPWAMASAVGFLAISWLFAGAFVVFLAYEAAAMLMALAMYVSLGMTHRLPGAPLVSAGIVLTLVAGAIQASPLRVRLIVPFDHNGLFHLVQIVATAVVAIGLRRGGHDAAAIQSGGNDGRQVHGCCANYLSGCGSRCHQRRRRVDLFRHQFHEQLDHVHRLR